MKLNVERNILFTAYKKNIKQHVLKIFWEAINIKKNPGKFPGQIFFLKRF
jgi:hypothetical protein